MSVGECIPQGDLGHGCESRCESVKIGGYCNGPNVNVECAIHIRSVQLHNIVYIDILSRFVTLVITSVTKRDRISIYTILWS